jgi:hypothetical protein
VISSPRRYLIAAGVENYRYLSNLDLPLVPLELKRVTAALVQIGYKRLLPRLASNPTKMQLVARINEGLGNLTEQSTAMLAFYFTGHGHFDGDRHYLILSDSNADDLDGTALPVEELARILMKKRHFQQTLIILDVCYAGRGNDEIGAIFQRLKNAFSSYLGSGAFLLASARGSEQASQGVFSEAFARVILNEDGQWGGKTQPFLTRIRLSERSIPYCRNLRSKPCLLLWTLPTTVACFQIELTKRLCLLALIWRVSDREISPSIGSRARTEPNLSRARATSAAERKLCGN